MCIAAFKFFQTLSFHSNLIGLSSILQVMFYCYHKEPPVFSLYCLLVVESTFFHVSMAGHNCPVLLFGYPDSICQKMEFCSSNNILILFWQYKIALYTF